MGLFSDIFGSKKSTDSKTDSTTTPVIPSWIQDPIQGYTQDIANLGNTDPYSWVAPATDNQTKAWAGGSTLGDDSTGYYGQALQQLNGIANASAPIYKAATYDATTGKASSLLDNLNGYMSPYQDSVVNPALAQWDKNAGATRAQDDLTLADSGAFGGSGAAITKAMTNDNLALGRQQTAGNLYDQMFNTGAGLSNEDAGRRQSMDVANMDALNQAGQFDASAQNAARQFNAQSWNQQLDRGLAAANDFANVTGAMDTNTRNNLTLQDQLGGDERAVNQDYISAPISLLGTQTSMTNGLPLNMFAGSHQVGTGQSTTVSTPSVAQVAGQIAQMIAMSDMRLKTNIERVGTHPDGYGIWDWNYLWDMGTRYRGAMAQELLNFKPEAVVELANGYLAVNYGAL